MKLISTSRKGKHAEKRSFLTKKKSAVPASEAAAPVQGGTAKRRKMSGRRKAVIITCTVLGLLILLLGAAIAVVRWEVQPFYDIFFPRPDESKLAAPRTPGPVQPEQDNLLNPAESPVPIDAQNPEANTPPVLQTRNMNKVTFLILGVDGYKGLRSEGGANTDVVMVASFDMDEYTMEIASIPRDTIVNVSWSVKKINSIWANMNAAHGSNSDMVMAKTKEHFADFIGFDVDFWVMVDMAAFESLVNAMPAGGVRFNVPANIHMEEPSIGMNVTLSRGDQLLNGKQALALLRYRGYSSGDYGRMETQQQFLKSAAEQILSRRDSLDPVELAKILLNYVKTDMDITTMTRIGREMLKLDGESINFTSAPSTPYGYAGGSYVYVNLDEWLEIVNEKLSPFYEEITPQHVSILTMGDNRRFYVTDDNWQGSQNWGR